METLYLDEYSFNISRILTQLAVDIKTLGGKLKHGHEAEVILRKDSLNIEHPTGIGLSKRIIFTVTHITYIEFAYEGVVYYFQFDDNPLFPCKYIKTPVRNGKYSRDAYLKSCYIAIPYEVLSSEQVRESTKHLFKELINAEMSEIHHETKRVKVPNLYDGGWHYEKVPVPERMETISEKEWY